MIVQWKYVIRLLTTANIYKTKTTLRIAFENYAMAFNIMLLFFMWESLDQVKWNIQLGDLPNINMYVTMCCWIIEYASITGVIMYLLCQLSLNTKYWFYCLILETIYGILLDLRIRKIPASIGKLRQAQTANIGNLSAVCC